MRVSTFRQPEVRLKAGCRSALAGQMGMELGFIIGKGVIITNF